MKEPLIRVTYPLTGYVVAHILCAGLISEELRAIPPEQMLVQTMRERGYSKLSHNVLLCTQSQLLLLLECSEKPLVLAPKRQRDGTTTLELTEGYTL